MEGCKGRVGQGWRGHYSHCQLQWNRRLQQGPGCIPVACLPAAAGHRAAELVELGQLHSPHLGCTAAAMPAAVAALLLAPGTGWGPAAARRLAPAAAADQKAGMLLRHHLQTTRHTTLVSVCCCTQLATGCLQRPAAARGGGGPALSCEQSQRTALSRRCAAALAARQVVCMCWGRPDATPSFMTGRTRPQLYVDIFLYCAARCVHAL